MFRYNDPREAAKMRQNIIQCKENGGNTMSSAHLNRSLLSQSLSDLRISAGNNSFSLAQNQPEEDLDIQEICGEEESLNVHNMFQKDTINTTKNVSSIKCNSNHNQNAIKYNSNQLPNEQRSVIDDNSSSSNAVIENNMKCNQLCSDEFTTSGSNINSAISSSKICDRKSNTKTKNTNLKELNISAIEERSIQNSQEDSEQNNSVVLVGHPPKLIDRKYEHHPATSPAGSAVEDGSSTEMTTSRESECSSASSIHEMAKLYEQIGEQKEMVMK